MIFERNKTKMKKKIILTLCAVIIAAFCICGIAGAEKTDYPFNPGGSEMYSYDEIVAAADVIMAKFSEWEGCQMYLLEYAGDERSQDELEYVKANYEGQNDECMVFMSAFRSPKEATMAWAADEDYCWSWTLVRAEGGEWQLNNWGWSEPYLKSKLYSVYDLLGASEDIRYEMEQMEGTKVLNVSYKNDAESKMNLDYINSLEKGEYDEAAVFQVWFMSPKEAYGAWEPDTLYTWDWFLGRSDKGYWETVTYGN